MRIRLCRAEVEDVEEEKEVEELRARRGGVADDAVGASRPVSFCRFSAEINPSPSGNLDSSSLD